MATRVEFQEVFSHDGSLWFKFCGNGEAFSVNSLNKGVMVISPMQYCRIESIAKNIAGCFEEGSNFYGLKAIEFEHHGAHVSVNAKNADPDKIVKLWRAKMLENQKSEK